MTIGLGQVALLETVPDAEPARPRYRRSRITIEPGMMFGQPCIDRHRITAEQMAGCWWYGWTAEDISDNWTIDRADLLVACWYMAKYGGRTWRKRWRTWADSVFNDLWGAEKPSSEIPLPPQSEVKS